MIKIDDYIYNDVILETKKEAKEILMRLKEIFNQYGFIRVADLYDLSDVNTNYKDIRYGWTNIGKAEVLRVKEGYMIKMPEIEKLQID